MESLPLYISIGFVLTTLLTVFIFYKASNKSTITLIVLFAWLALQTVIGLTGFYTITDTLPPRFVLLVSPPLIFIVFLFATSNGLKNKWHRLLCHYNPDFSRGLTSRFFFN